MTNIIKTPATKVDLDSYHTEGDQIKAFTIINETEDIDFVIDLEEFKEWCDEKELRLWHEEHYSPVSGYMQESNLIPWIEIDGLEFGDFLKQYIQWLYDRPGSISNDLVKAIA